MNSSVNNKKQKSIYLVLNPQMQEDLLIERLNLIIDKGISYIQIWDNFMKGQDIGKMITEIHSISSAHQVPLLINNHWKYLRDFPLDGVHFDSLPANLTEIKQNINKDFIIGVTCGNDLSVIELAAEQNVDYISFCSLFPSLSARNCEIVELKNIEKARQIFKKSIFLSGGIIPENICKLADLDYDGIALISGLMSVETPQTIIEEYKKRLNKIK